MFVNTKKIRYIAKNDDEEVTHSVGRNINDIDGDIFVSTPKKSNYNIKNKSNKSNQSYLQCDWSLEMSRTLEVYYT